MKNVENIQIQGEKQRAIYYLVEKNEKWFFRSLYPFHPVEIQNSSSSKKYFCFKVHTPQNFYIEEKAGECFSLSKIVLA